MTDFLNFLNTADHDTLKKISGISNMLADNIIAARPFKSADEILLVHGVGKSLLTRMQSFAEAQENESENRGMPQVEQEALPAPVGKSQLAQENVEEEETFISRLRRAFVNFLRALLKLILLVILIGGVGALLYYGLPYLNRTFVVPVEKNTAQIDNLESEISALQTQLSETNLRVDAMENSIESHTLSIQKLGAMQTTLEMQLQTNNDQVLLSLKHEVMMTRALDMLGRARLYLAQSNFGLAQEDVQSARNLLSELQFETQDDALSQVLVRLDLALGNLPAFPVVAAGDLEIAWQILMSGSAPVTATATFIPTVTPAAVETFTPTPFDLPTAISTP